MGGGRRGWWRAVNSRRIRAPPASQAAYLALAMTSAVMLAWWSYVASGVAPEIMADFAMSFRYYVAVATVSIALGATGALAAGLADRVGRVVIVAGGLLLSSLLVLVALPNAQTKTSYLFLTALNGAAGVALPALVRDFSPQVRRATAMALMALMALWAWGPVLDSLIVTGVARCAT